MQGVLSTKFVDILWLLLITVMCLLRDNLYVETLQHVQTLCTTHNLWNEALVLGERLLPTLRSYSKYNTRVIAALLLR